MKAVGAAAILAPLVRGDGEPTLQEEGPDSPRICLEIGGGSLAAGMSLLSVENLTQHIIKGVSLVAGSESIWRNGRKV